MLKPIFIHDIEESVQPKFLSLPNRITYTRGNKLGTKYFWESTPSYDTVHILVNKVDTQELLFAVQTRIPVLAKYPAITEVTECCAGLIDKYPEEANPATRAARIASDEIHEEMGYDVYMKDLTVLPTYMSNVGMSGSVCHPFYCEVTDDDFIGTKFEESEDIETLAISYKELRGFLQTCTATDATTRALIMWFLLNRLQ